MRRTGSPYRLSKTRRAGMGLCADARIAADMKVVGVQSQ